MNTLVEKIVALHAALTRAEFSHAFGGALALAWCTQQARGTIDIDVNIFVGPLQSEAVLKALPDDVAWSAQDLGHLESEGQVRVWWEKTPLDLFLNSTTYHDQLWQRIRWEYFASERLPFIACLDLAVFKAFFNRTKDWADLEAMRAAGTLDSEQVIRILVEYVGREDERIGKLQALLESGGG